MRLVAKMNDEAVGSAAWELPQDVSDRFLSFDKSRQDKLQAELDKALRTFADLAVATMRSKGFNRTGFRPLQQTLVTASIEHARNLGLV